MGCCSSRSDIEPASDEVHLKQFRIVRVIGKGAFGKVSIVEKKSDKRLFALKYILKEKCIEDRAVKHIIQERNLLEQIKHEFICNLRYSFQDDNYMFMVLDLMLGGDVRFHLDKPFSPDAARIIIAEVASALNYLHSNYIVHRDLKPENIILDDAGHAYLTDFNIAVKFTPGKPLKSIAGTEPYMAPELLLGVGYYASVDWWSLGVILFEMVFRERPFRGKDKRDKIQKGEWYFPPENKPRPVSPECCSLIEELLESEPDQRIGVGANMEAFRKHTYFNGLDWQALERKQITPTFVPPSKASNFNAMLDLEEVLLEDRPLKATNRKADISKMSDAMIMIEKDFLYYDYTNPTKRNAQEQHQHISGFPRLEPDANQFTGAPSSCGRFHTTASGYVSSEHLAFFETLLYWW
ncbi:kinase-like domain-containing protein [Cladochytrium replicatum]|nr:kinase-like domain-containing protein [Cladochytrium replicatum]